MNYQDFLKTKRLTSPSYGIDVSLSDLNPKLFDFQKQLVKWALRKGRAALLCDTGLGKCVMALEWARQLNVRTLIVAPLSVARQTVWEGQKFGYDVHYTRSGDDLTDSINVTNYEMIEHFDANEFGAVVLDESSILKGLDSKTRTKLTEMFADTSYRLCCTATPAPNDIAEIANHAEFLGIMTRIDMLATFFVHDDQGWRLKRHAYEPFYRWLASWGMSVRRPSDIGYDDTGYILPPLNINPIFLETDYCPPDQLFFTGLKGIQDRNKVRKATISDKIQKTVEIINGSKEQWICWCGLNDEGRELHRLIPDSVLQEGSDKPEKKIADIQGFQDGKIRVLVTKGKIAGFGLNLQNCSNMVFVGLNDSYEMMYQAIRRCYRFGQTKPVNVYIVLSTAEEEIYENVKKKEQEALVMAEELIKNVQQFEKVEIGQIESNFVYQTNEASGEKWRILLGDSAERLKEIPERYCDLSIYSPPFISLYAYSATERDIGNSKTESEFFAHYDFIIKELLRITKEGRNTCVHVAQVPAMLVRDGWIGLKDFRGMTIKAYEEAGWIYHGEVVIDKDPQALRHGTKVMTPAGWKSIEDMQVGDYVIGSNGQATEVTGVYPQGKRQLYRISFSDGVSIDCDAVHLWTVESQYHRYRTSKSVTVSAKTLSESGIYMPAGKPRYWLTKLKAPVVFEEQQPFTLDPYLFGVLLGDGNITQRSSISVTTEHAIVEMCSLPTGHKFRLQSNTEKGNGTVATYHIVSDQWHRNDVLNAIKQLGLHGCRAWEKSIPHQYQYASVDNRRRLLQGLLDTDGTVKQNGAVTFTTTSESLAKDMQFLVESLGGMVTLNSFALPHYLYKGESCIGQQQWHLNIQLDGDWCPFALNTKAAKWHSRKRQASRSVISIGPINEEDNCTCISVAAPDGLYVTEHFILTHNSQAIRTHSKALLFAQLKKDASWLRPALADYILVFRRPGDNAVPVKPDITNDEWISWARPIWYGIRESDTLQYHQARGEDDTRHICPLQLGTIERCIRLWSNPDEMIVSPFAGIGSEGYEAIRLGRKFTGIELKDEYYKVAISNLKRAEQEAKSLTLFDFMSDTGG